MYLFILQISEVIKFLTPNEVAKVSIYTTSYNNAITT